MITVKRIKELCQCGPACRVGRHRKGYGDGMMMIKHDRYFETYVEQDVSEECLLEIFNAVDAKGHAERRHRVMEEQVSKACPVKIGDPEHGYIQCQKPEGHNGQHVFEPQPIE